MKNLTFLVLTTLLFSLLAACSKHRVASASLSAKPTNLGIVEVSDGKPIYRDLGGRKACIISPTVFTDGLVRLTISIQETNFDGTIRTIAAPTVQNIAGSTMAVSAGDIYIRVTPLIKQ